MIVLSPTEFLKAKYTRRWRGKDGKWNYEYGPKRHNTRAAKEGIYGKQYADARAGGGGKMQLREDKPGYGDAPKKLDAKTKKTLSAAMHEAAPESYYKHVPIDKIGEAFEKKGFVLVDGLDNTEWSGMLVGSKGRVSIAIGHASSKHKVNGVDSYKILEGARLQIQWEKVGNNKYDVTKYIM